MGFDACHYIILKCIIYGKFDGKIFVEYYICIKISGNIATHYLYRNRSERALLAFVLILIFSMFLVLCCFKRHFFIPSNNLLPVAIEADKVMNIKHVLSPQIKTSFAQNVCAYSNRALSCNLNLFQIALPLLIPIL